jgi:hypothetical protein
LETQNRTNEEAQQQQEDALRQQVQRDIDATRVQIEAALALLNAHPNREELASQITALQSQLMQLDGLRQEAITGNMTQLAALQVGVTISVGATQNLTSQVTSAAAVESFQSVMIMSYEQMAVLEQHHWQQTEYFQQFEADMSARIDELAAANGVDMSTFHANQRRLEAEYEDARARGDLAGMLKADALRATNVRIGLEQAGASEAEIQAAREQEKATQKAYLNQTAIEARREAEQQGMSADAVKDHVAGAVAQADAGLDGARAELIAETPSLILDAPQEGFGFGQSYEVAEANEVTAPLPTPEHRESEVVVQL